MERRVAFDALVEMLPGFFTVSLVEFLDQTLTFVVETVDRADRGEGT